MKVTSKILYQEFRPYVWRICFIIFLILLTAGFEALSPYPFKVLIDNVLGNQRIEAGTLEWRLLHFITSRESLGYVVILIYGLSIFFGSLAEYGVNVANRKLSKEVIKNFSLQAYEALQNLGVAFFNKTKLGDYIYRLSYDVSAIGDMLEFGIIPLLTNLGHLAFTLFIIFYISPTLAGVACLILPVLTVMLYIYNREIGQASANSERYNSKLFSYIQQALSQMKIIQAFNQQRRFSEQLKKREEDSLDGELKMDELSYQQDMLLGLIIALGYCVVIVFGVRLVFSGSLSTGLLVAFVLYLDNLTYPLLEIINSSVSCREDFIKVSRMNEFFVSRFQIKDRGSLQEFQAGDVVFNKVSMVSDSGDFTLNKASFTIPKNKKTVIVGVSGSGKTTLLSLLLRFVEPEEGQITIGGQDISEYALKVLRDAIAYVPQETELFDDSIWNNVVFTGEAAETEVRQALNLAVAEEFVDSKQEQYDYQVGPEGQALSGGQRQRLLIARALMKTQAPVVIMDEPFSSLDPKSRLQLMRNLDKFSKHKTLIIVSNVLDIIQEADNIIVVNNGEIIHAKDKSRLFNEKTLSSLIQNV